MSLDAFMATHTSEDNASFAEILEGINKRKRERHAWLHNQIKEKEVRPPPRPTASSTGVCVHLHEQYAHLLCICIFLTAVILYHKLQPFPP